jgi:hypothetical protein
LGGKDQAAPEKDSAPPLPPTKPAGLRLRLAGTVVGSAGGAYAILEEAPGRFVLTRGDRWEELLSFQTVDDATPSVEEGSRPPQFATAWPTQSSRPRAQRGYTSTMKAGQVGGHPR